MCYALCLKWKEKGQKKKERIQSMLINNYVRLIFVYLPQ